jgi:cytochrome c oxidase subunit 2
VEVDFVTANELHIPVGKTIQLTVGSPDDGVIHSYWVPSINGKKDAVPGRGELLKFQVDEPGLYRGQCAEYCGLSHADMRIRVFAQTPADYEAWAAAERSGLDPEAAKFVTDNLSVDDAQAGKFSCVRCHAFNGVEGAEARIGPNLTHVGDRSTFAAGIYETNLKDLTEWVYDAPSKKPFGNYENHMPSFKDAGMTKDQAAEIARFLLCDTQTPEGQAALEQFTPEVAQQHQEDCR